MRSFVPGALCAVLLSTALIVPTHAQNPRFSESELRAWLTYLASDELQGRQAYTEGLGLAAAYIADRVREFGLTPAGDNGGFLQTVKVLGVRTRSNSSVTVTVNGKSRTFKDGQGVTFARNQGARQVVTAPLEFVGYGHTFAPLKHDDYAGREMRGKVALYVGRGAPGMTDTHNRLINARGRTAIEGNGAAGAIGPAARPANNATTTTTSNNPQRVDFQTAQRLDHRIAPQITVGDDFYEFVFSAIGKDYDDLKKLAEKQQPLPAIDLKGATVTFTIDADYDIIQTRFTRNVVALLDGADPVLRSRYVILGAHYDHVGYQQFGTPDQAANLIASCPGQARPTPKPGDIINNGADDDGSGTVALLGIAKAMATGTRPKQSVLFVWHTAEEGGLNGSRYMADYPVVPMDRVSAALNIDMIGRNKCDDPAQSNTVFLVGSDRISTELHNINEEANASLPAPMTLDYELNDASDLESIYTRSDHYSYASKGVPVIFFTTGLHRDYHYVTDEVEKIDFGKLARVAELVHATAMRVGNLETPPARDNKGPRVGKGQSGKIP